jgi:hypothetical protein
MSSTSKENGVRRGKFGGSILFAVEDIEKLLPLYIIEIYTKYEGIK